MIWRANSTHVCATYMLPESCRCSSDPSVGALSLLSGSQQTPVAVGKGKGGWVTSSLTVSPLHVVLLHRIIVPEHASGLIYSLLSTHSIQWLVIPAAEISHGSDFFYSAS